MVRLKTNVDIFLSVQAGEGAQVPEPVLGRREAVPGGQENSHR